MPRKRLAHYLPNPEKIRANPALKPVAHMLGRSEIWHLNRRSVSGAAFVGFFCAFLPVPMQMVIAAAFAIIGRCNLPISVALVWISNPLTMPPMFYFSYRLGAWLLNMRLEVQSIELSAGWLWGNLGTIGYPLIFGSLVCGWVCGVTAFVITRVVWRWRVIAQWRERRARLKHKRGGTGSV